MAEAETDQSVPYHFKAISRLGSRSVLLIRAAAFASVLYGIALAYQLDFLTTAQNGGFATQSELEAAADLNDSIILFAVILWILLILVSGIVFLIWVYRAAANVHLIRSGAMTITPGWAVGWNFIPIAWYWIPYQAVKQIWQASFNISTPETVDVPGMFFSWWFCWIASQFVGRASDRVFERGAENGDFAQMSTGTLIGIADCFLFIAACYFLSKIVLEITEMQGTLSSNTADIFE